ncbi:MAG: hypothetical protein IKL07_07235 [Clostridium sp.]|nr:hypothetical protein [Clostridium sp.]
MLKKLIKYDLQAMFKYFIPMTAFALLYSCIATLFFKIENVGNYDNTLTNLFIGLSIAGFVIIFFAYCIIAQGIIVVDFFKSMVTDRGYLTHTLPVKKSTIILSKYIAGTIVLTLTYLFTFLSLAIFLDFPRLWTENADPIKDTFREIFALVSPGSIALFAVSFIFTCFVSFVFNIATYHLSIAIGQRMNRHKIVGSIISYGALTITFSIITNIITFVIQFGAYFTTDKEILSLSTYSLILFGGSIFLIVLTVVMAILTHYIFSTKLNLD